jgi:hypothetical protein
MPVSRPPTLPNRGNALCLITSEQGGLAQTIPQSQACAAPFHTTLHKSVKGVPARLRRRVTKPSRRRQPFMSKPRGSRKATFRVADTPRRDTDTGAVTCCDERLNLRRRASVAFTARMYGLAGQQFERRDRRRGPESNERRPVDDADREREDFLEACGRRCPSLLSLSILAFYFSPRDRHALVETPCLGRRHEIIKPRFLRGPHLSLV